MKIKSFISLSLVLALSILLVTPASAFFAPSNGQAATLVLGQPDFTSSGSGLNSKSFLAPTRVAVDPATGKVFVSDTANDRVLRFANAAALSSGAAAEAVLGQPDFTSNSPQTSQSGMGYCDVTFAQCAGPAGVAADTSGRLWVADPGNNRVLRFDNAAGKASSAKADGVLGQPDFLSRAQNTTQDGMNAPFGLAADSSGRLWVVDLGNRRVLRFDNAASKANGANADGVLGQPDFTSAGGAVTQSEMFYPIAAAADTSGHLWVADAFGNRVLRFDNAAAKANGANADGVLGQTNFTSSGGVLTQSGMQLPSDVAVDTKGRLYVADDGHCRILIFDSAAKLADGANASSVLGQPDFTTGTPNTGGLSSTSLFGAFGVAYDPVANVLWAVDPGNNRVLMYGSLQLNIPPVIGLINFYLPPGTTVEGMISIVASDGSIHTFEVSPDTRILPSSRAGQLGVGTPVSILSRRDPATGRLLAFQIIVHLAGSGLEP